MKSKLTTFFLGLIISVTAFAGDNGTTDKQELFTTQTKVEPSKTYAANEATKFAPGPVSVTDKLFSQKKPSQSDTQSCGSDDTGVITIYTTNGMAYSKIDVSLDGSHIGSLKTYYPDDEPGCKTESGAGIISIVVPAGKHTLDADSSNITWPSHDFSVEKCGCMVLPLS